MRVLITGIAGQDGSILADLHLEKGDQVWGTVSNLRQELSTKCEGVRLLNIGESVITPQDLSELVPDRIYHVAAKHFSSTTKHESRIESEAAMYSCHVTATRNILEWQIQNPNAKSLIALSSQMYKPTTRETIISEDTKCRPQNYYAKTKLEAFNLIRYYREKYGVKSAGAILFNHTSIRSKRDFLFPKLAFEIANVISNSSDSIFLDFADTLIDICHAEEICLGMKQLLDLEEPRELVFSSGRLLPVSEIIKETMILFGFNGQYNLQSRQSLVLPSNFLRGDPSLAKTLLGWQAKLSPWEILTQQVRVALTS